MARVGLGHGSRHGIQRLDVEEWSSGEGGRLTGTKGHRQRAERHSSGRLLRGRRIAKRRGSACAHRRAFLEYANSRAKGEEQQFVEICKHTFIG